MEEMEQLLDFWVTPFVKRCRTTVERGQEQHMGDKAKNILLVPDEDHVHKTPKKKTPVLLHDDRTVCESLVILQYVDKGFPATAQHLLKSDDDPNAPGDAAASSAADGFRVEYVNKKVYDCGTLLWRLKEEPQARAEVAEILRTLEAELGDKPYFAGYGEAGLGPEDVGLMPFAEWFLGRELAGEFNVKEECPRLTAWAKRCGERDHQESVIVKKKVQQDDGPVVLLRPAGGAQVVGTSMAEKPLRRMAAEFEELAAVAERSPAGEMDLGTFSSTCSTASVLLGCFGIAFKFAEMDFASKVDDLLEASKSISTLRSMVELDIQKDTVREVGSHTRNLLRVKRGIDVVKVLFEQTLLTEGFSLRDAAPAAYAQVLAPHHGLALRMAVSAALYTIPSKSQLLKKFNEDEESAKALMQNFVRSSAEVVLYVEDLFTSRNLGIDW
ncbi:unnamed protein product [Urochloa humidicola]